VSDDAPAPEREIKLRKTSKVAMGKTPFPWDWDLVPFVYVGPERIYQAVRVSDKVKLILDAKGKEGVVVLAPWPGETRQDCFVMDDLDEALRELGYPVDDSSSQAEPATDQSADVGAQAGGPGDAAGSPEARPSGGGDVQPPDPPQVA
jgi:hypothetical protein